MWKKWGRLEWRSSGKILKGRVTSGTEFRKILSPLPCHLLPSLDTITQKRKTQKSIQPSQYLRRYDGSDEMSIENHSLVDTDGLPEVSRHWNRQLWEGRDTSSRTFPISWPHTSHHNRLSCAIINAMMLYQKPTRLNWIAVSTSDTSEVNSAIATGSSGKVHRPALFAWHICLCSWFGH